MATIDRLAGHLGLGALLNELSASFGVIEHLDHWKQGEFHHDLLLRIPNATPALLGRVLVVATNCNGGVKELLCFDRLPERSALWHERCPETPSSRGRFRPCWQPHGRSTGLTPVASCPQMLAANSGQSIANASPAVAGRRRDARTTESSRRCCLTCVAADGRAGLTDECLAGPSQWPSASWLEDFARS